MGGGVEWMVEFWGQQAIGCRMRVVAVSEQFVNEFNGLIYRPARGPGPGTFSWMPGNLQSLQLPTNEPSADGWPSLLGGQSLPWWQLGADPAATTTQT